MIIDKTQTYSDMTLEEWLELQCLNLELYGYEYRYYGLLVDPKTGCELSSNPFRHNSICTPYMKNKVSVLEIFKKKYGGSTIHRVSKITHKFWDGFAERREYSGISVPRFRFDDNIAKELSDMGFLEELY